MQFEPGYEWLAERESGWQFGEAGVLAALGEKLLGGNPGVVMEIGAGCPYNAELSSQRLFDNGWRLVLVDCNETACRTWAQKLASDRACCVYARIRHTAPKPEHMVELAKSPSPDILTIDIDSEDYYVWKESALCPAIVMVEHRNDDGSTWPDAPYPWERSDLPGAPAVFQANLPAMVELAKSKGYTLAASNRINGIYLRNDVAEALKG